MESVFVNGKVSSFAVAYATLQMPFLFHPKAGCTAGAGEKVNSIVYAPTSRLQLAGTFRVQVFPFSFFLSCFLPFPRACATITSGQQKIVDVRIISRSTFEKHFGRVRRLGCRGCLPTLLKDVVLTYCTHVVWRANFGRGTAEEVRRLFSTPFQTNYSALYFPPSLAAAG